MPRPFPIQESVEQRLASGDADGAFAELEVLFQDDASPEEDRQTAAFWACTILVQMDRIDEAVDLFDATWDSPDEAGVEVRSLGGRLRALAGDAETAYRWLGSATQTAPDVEGFVLDANRSLALAGAQRLGRGEFEAASRAFATVRGSLATAADEEARSLAEAGFRAASLGRWLEHIRAKDFSAATIFLERAEKAGLPAEVVRECRAFTALSQAGTLVEQDPDGRRPAVHATLARALDDAPGGTLLDAAKSLASMLRALALLTERKLTEAERGFADLRAARGPSSTAAVAWALLRARGAPGDPEAKRILDDARRQGIGGLEETVVPAPPSFLKEKARLMQAWEDPRGGGLPRDTIKRDLQRILAMEEALRGAAELGVPIAPLADAQRSTADRAKSLKRRLKVLVHRIEQVLPRIPPARAADARARVRKLKETLMGSDASAQEKAEEEALKALAGDLAAWDWEAADAVR